MSHPEEIWYHRCGKKRCSCAKDPWYDTLDPVWHQLRDYCRHESLKGTKPHKTQARECMREAMWHIKQLLKEETVKEEENASKKVKKVNLKKEQTKKKTA